MSNYSNKIMYLMDVYDNPWGGTEGQLYKLIEQLNKKGYKPFLTLFRSNEYFENNEFPCPVKILGIKKIISIDAIVKMIKFSKGIKKEGVKFVHIYFNDASILAPIILKLFGIKVIISRRDMGYWYDKLNLFILRINRFFVDRVIVNSKAVQLITADKEKYPLDKIEVIYNGVDIDELVVESPGILRRELKLQSNDIILGIVANLRPIKRMDDVIAALSRLKYLERNIHFVVLGEDEINNGKSLRDKYINLADQYGVKEYVHFLGVIRNVRPYIEDFDIGIMSSESEGLSNSIIEYMASSKPTICTIGSGNSELITHNITGCLYEAGNIDSLAECVLYLINNKYIAHEMGERSRDKVRNMFGIDKYINSYLNLYNDLLSK